MDKASGILILSLSSIPVFCTWSNDDSNKNSRTFSHYIKLYLTIFILITSVVKADSNDKSFIFSIVLLSDM